MSTRNDASCYVNQCNNHADTVEHAPPQVFFPEYKDVGIDYRDPLVTVPACRDHNNAYSKDDEYVAFIMHSHYKTNQAAIKNFDTKILRAMDRNKKLINAFYKDLRKVWILEGRKLRRRAIFDVDKIRVNRVMCRIASALYYKIQNRRISIDSSFYRVYSPDTHAANLKSDCPQDMEEYLASKNCYLPLPLWNQDIFLCDYHIDPNEPERFVFRFTFYGNLRYRVIH